MRKKIALVTVIASLAVMFAMAQAAYASYVSVYVKYSASGLCQPAVDQVSYKLKFKADVTAIGVAKPKRVRVGYQIVDSDTKRVLRSGITNLKRSSGYKGDTKRFTAVAGENLSYHLNMKYTIGGSEKKLKKSFPDFIPSSATLNGAGLPAC